MVRSTQYLLLEDVFAVQADIAQSVALALEVRLLGQAFAPATVDPGMSLAHARAVSGDRLGAERLLSELKEASTLRYVSPYLLAQVYVGLEMCEAALDCLEKASVARASELPWISVRPVFDSIRDEPRFATLMAQLRL